jgi:hypothetical protein
MATSTRLELTEQQREELAAALRVEKSRIPRFIGIVAVSNEAAERMAVASQEMTFLPAMLIT